MSVNFRPNIPNLLVLIKPCQFGFNKETKESNHFQKSIKIENLTYKVSNEFEGVVTILLKNNIAIKVFEDRPSTYTPDAIFLNNWISHLPNGLVTVFPMLAKNRQQEVREDIIDYFIEWGRADKLIDLTKEVRNNRFLEGTGSIVFDHFRKEAYACLSERTNLELLKEYCSEIGYCSIPFISKDENDLSIYHTNVMLSITEKYILVCLDSIIDSSINLYLQKSNKVVIPISQNQVKNFAGNVIEVLDKDGRSCLIMSETAYTIFTDSQLGIISSFSKIICVNVATIEKIGGGGIRCMLAGLFV